MADRSPRVLCARLLASTVFGFGLFFALSRSAPAADELGLDVPPGFSISRYADDTLAHDIFSMTIDSLGRVVVSGPGYVKILIDSDQDGRADKAKTFAPGPQTGAQGLYFLGRDLLCTGDAGLIRYKDEDADDKADGPPETFLKIKTGGEHNAHAVRRGPDGWWYLIAGNTTDITRGYATLPSSPIKEPNGGVVLRLAPDLAGGEIIADGFRNAYDFDFDLNGELYVYDSDGERDISLPWYLPTRVFQALPGANHGWVTDSWKVPDYFLDAAPVAASTGRGSPTGVHCYRHTQFPAEYHNTLFVLDWTFGRVIHVPLGRNGASFQGEAKPFVTTRGQFGFAPTDLEVGPDGSLFVCVGGRGTHGTVYKITHTGSKTPPRAHVPAPVADSATADERLAACLAAPQPQSSWSRVRWVPLALKLGPQPFLRAALADDRPIAARVRAIEILTELFEGLPGTAAELLAAAKPVEVRARAAWSLGVKPDKHLTAEVMAMFLADADPLVRRRAVESVGRLPALQTPALVAALVKCLADDSRHVRIAAARLLPEMNPQLFRELSEAARRAGWKAALTTTLGYVWRSHSRQYAVNLYGADLGKRILEGEYPPELKLEALRVIQVALGDLGSSEENAPVFDGYISSLDLAPKERELDPLRISLAGLFPTGNPRMDVELSRTIAMLAPLNPELLTKVVDQITPTSSPVDDVHYLTVAARIPVPRSKPQRAKIAEALVMLEPKLQAQKLSVDNNYNDRIGELYGKLVDIDAELPPAVVAHPAFGRPAHVLYLGRCQEAETRVAVKAFAKAASEDPNYPWNNDVVFVFGFPKEDEYYDLVRAQFDRFAVRMAVIMVLAEKPQEKDRALFATGLDSGPIEVLSAAVGALEKLSTRQDGYELVQLVKLLRRLGSDKSDYPLKERVAALLKRNTGEDAGYLSGTAGHLPQPQAVEKWTAWVVEHFPKEAAEHLGGGESDLTVVKQLIANVDWSKGDSSRGQKLFQARGCAQCHGGGRGLGPDLAGAAGRFSRDDLFIAIALPNRDVSPRYQTTLVETVDGKTYTGLIVYESVDGLLLRNGTNQTFRIEARDIESRKTLPNSLMPGGLLKDLKPADLADLYTYLQSLGVQTAESTAAAKKD